MRCAPGAEHPGRWCAGRNDEGTIGILTLGFGVLVLMVVLVVAFANIFTVIQPVMDAGDWSSAMWMLAGRFSFRYWRWGFMRITADVRR